MFKLRVHHVKIVNLVKMSSKFQFIATMGREAEKEENHLVVAHP